MGNCCWDVVSVTCITGSNRSVKHPHAHPPRFVPVWQRPLLEASAGYNYAPANALQASEWASCLLFASLLVHGGPRVHPSLLPCVNRDTWSCPESDLQALERSHRCATHCSSCLSSPFSCCSATLEESLFHIELVCTTRAASNCGSTTTPPPWRPRATLNSTHLCWFTGGVRVWT